MPGSLVMQSFDLTAPTQEWEELAEVFISCFGDEPYCEDPRILKRIVNWGPAMLAGDGRLVTARRDGVLVGFALGSNLSTRPDWQRTLGRIGSSGRLPGMKSQCVFIIHELAVLESERGRGIAAVCTRMLLIGRREEQVILGVFARADGARQVYRNWGFEEFGRARLGEDAEGLHVLTSSMAAAARIGIES